MSTLHGLLIFIVLHLVTLAGEGGTQSIEIAVKLQGDSDSGGNASATQTPPATYNCSINNGDCEQVCQRAPKAAGHWCACRTGYVLRPPDHRRCSLDYYYVVGAAVLGCLTVFGLPAVAAILCRNLQRHFAGERLHSAKSKRRRKPHAKFDRRKVKFQRLQELPTLDEIAEEQEEKEDDEEEEEEDECDENVLPNEMQHRARSSSNYVVHRADSLTDYDTKLV